ncbi:hypothetical protein VH571_15640 [Frondihabitans sp. 4ASC-45]|uniref:hypothetical protein n=1 Tax=Frondihabitans sp. 4ASC-45 TaxID=3111636 RepID=UPI003C1E9516
MSAVSGYHILLASSVGERDGMGLELLSDVDGERVAEVFEDGDTKIRTFSAFRAEAIPLTTLMWFLEKAEERL